MHTPILKYLSKNIYKHYTPISHRVEAFISGVRRVFSCLRSSSLFIYALDKNLCRFKLFRVLNLFVWIVVWFEVIKMLLLDIYSISFNTYVRTSNQISMSWFCYYITSSCIFRCTARFKIQKLTRTLLNVYIYNA